MEDFLKTLSETYYTLPVMAGIQIIAVLISFHKRNRFPELKHLQYYPLAGICQVILGSDIGSVFFEGKISYQFTAISINLYSLIEVLLIYQFAFRIIKIKKLRSALKFPLICFLIFVLFTWLSTDAFFWNPSRLFLLEGIVILIPTCFYFFQIFKLPPTISLTDQPAFWLNIGIFFAFCCTFPLSTLEYFFEKFIQKNYHFYYINYVAYSILHLFLIRGYLCKVRSENLETTIVFGSEMILSNQSLNKQLRIVGN